MKEYHLLAFLVTYYAVTRTSREKLKVPALPITLPKYTEYALCALPLLSTLNSGNTDSVEQLVVVLSYLFVIRAMKSLASGSEHTIEELLLPVFISGVIMTLYTNPELRRYMFLAYAVMIGYAALLLSKNKTTTDNVIDDFILSHLVFFFSK